MLKLGSKEMEKKKNSNVKSNKRRGKERRKEINSVVGRTFPNTSKRLKGFKD